MALPLFRSALQKTYLRIEELEARRLLTGYQPTDFEQVFLERLNDARANPAAYGATIGIDLSSVAPSQPLAFNPLLIRAARDHSQDMAVRNYFSHFTPEGADPGARIAAAGFSAVGWGESIAAGYSTPEGALRGLIIDAGVANLGHRRQLLAMDQSFQNQSQVGIGIATGGAYGFYYTIDTAAGTDPRPFLTGVVLNDSSGFYNPGRGMANVSITVVGAGATTTFSSGGYSFQVNPGTYTVTASGGGLGTPLVQNVTVGGNNFRLILGISASALSTQNSGNPNPPVVVNDAFGRPVIFVRGLDDQIYGQKFDINGSPTGGYFLAAPGRIKSFDAGNDANGNPILFAIGMNDRVYALQFDANANPNGSYYFTSDGAVKTLAVSRDAFNRPEVFVIGLDDQVWVQRFDGSGNPNGAGYVLTRAGRVLSMQPGRDAGGRPELFVVGMDNQVYGQRFDINGLSSSYYFLAASGQVKTLTVAHNASNNLEIYVIGLDDQVWALP
ncbi:MAG TPA: CAP domain-containing protein, partial [Gemmataceae bacterium]|nr:CAP domain-containing protein [Gemmataceae bacterium]